MIKTWQNIELKTHLQDNLQRKCGILHLSLRFKIGTCNKEEI